METVETLTASPNPALASPTSLLSHNISLNLGSIFSLLVPTTDFFARIWRGVSRSGMAGLREASSEGIGFDWGLGLDAVSEPEPQKASVQAAASASEPFQGLWAFFTSWYMLGLFLMAVLLHRIQNVIIPSHMQHHRRQRHAFRFGLNFAPRFQSLRCLYESMLPLDFSRTSTRFVLHLPSAYFLCRMLLIWSLLVLQTSEILPSWSGLGWLHDLVQWSSTKDMNDVCWYTFCAVCAAFLVEGFVKSLDGMGTGFPLGNTNPNTSPFNLIGYAFLLHVYSSPQTHSYKSSKDGGLSRPDKHVLITITIPLLQLTIFHLLSISKRLSSHRLFPTAISSMLSLLHFHGTLLSHYRRAHFGTILSTPTPTSIPSVRSSGHVNYPLLNYVPNFFETLLIGTIFLTLFLNALAQLLVRGRIDRLFSQLGIGSGSSLRDDEDGSQGFFASLPLEEDFGVLLLRVGIASLEATGLKGWGNEVAPIPLPLRGTKVRRSWTSSPAAPTFGSVRMGRLGTGEVRYGVADFASTGPSSLRSPRMVSDNVFAEYSAALRRRKPKAPVHPNYRRGFNNEVRTVDLGNTEAAGRGGGTDRWRWLKELYTYLVTLLAVMKGLFLFLLEGARGRVRISDGVQKAPLVPVVRRDGIHEEIDDGSGSEDRERRDRVLYERFLRGEDISDDDDEAEEGEETSSQSDELSNGDGEGEGEGEGGNDREAEAVTLFTDFLRNGSTFGHIQEGGGDGEIVLAHLAHGARGDAAGPLTRRRWNDIVQQQTVSREPQPRDTNDENRENREDETWKLSSGSEKQTVFDNNSDTGRTFTDACVICTGEKRNIICWPCRCLAMCDNCREALASKSSPSKHSCPCCRQTVEGYSKIYIP